MIDERLTPSFWLSEFLLSETATRRGIPNTPPPAEMSSLRTVLAPGMQQVRDILGAPVQITSGYRSPDLNRAVGGAPSSQHTQGLAADFVCPTVGTPRAVAEYLLQHGTNLRFDQLIYEGDWVHISFVPTKPRGQVLTAHFGPHGATYSAGLG